MLKTSSTGFKRNSPNRSTKFDVYTVWGQKVPTKDFCVCVTSQYNYRYWHVVTQVFFFSE
jgi:hypothetical protein